MSVKLKCNLLSYVSKFLKIKYSFTFWAKAVPMTLSNAISMSSLCPPINCIVTNIRITSRPRYHWWWSMHQSPLINMHDNQLHYIIILINLTLSLTQPPATLITVVIPKCASISLRNENIFCSSSFRRIAFCTIIGPGSANGSSFGTSPMSMWIKPTQPCLSNIY